MSTKIVLWSYHYWGFKEEDIYKLYIRSVFVSFPLQFTHKETNFHRYIRIKKSYPCTIYIYSESDVAMHQWLMDVAPPSIEFCGPSVICCTDASCSCTLDLQQPRTHTFIIHYLLGKRSTTTSLLAHSSVLSLSHSVSVCKNYKHWSLQGDPDYVFGVQILISVQGERER